MHAMASTTRHITPWHHHLPRQHHHPSSGADPDSPRRGRPALPRLGHQEPPPTRRPAHRPSSSYHHHPSGGWAHRFCHCAEERRLRAAAALAASTTSTSRSVTVLTRPTLKKTHTRLSIGAALSVALLLSPTAAIVHRRHFAPTVHGRRVCSPAGSDARAG